MRPDRLLVIDALAALALVVTLALNPIVPTIAVVAVAIVACALVLVLRQFGSSVSTVHRAALWLLALMVASAPAGLIVSVPLALVLALAGLVRR